MGYEIPNCISLLEQCGTFSTVVGTSGRPFLQTTYAHCPSFPYLVACIYLFVCLVLINYFFKAICKQSLYIRDLS